MERKKKPIKVVQKGRSERGGDLIDRRGLDRKI